MDNETEGLTARDWAIVATVFVVAMLIYGAIANGVVAPWSPMGEAAEKREQTSQFRPADPDTRKV